MVHIAVVGSGRVGGEVAFSLVFERYVTGLTLADTGPNVAEMTKEELYHAATSHGFDIKISACQSSKKIQNADLIVIAAGFPRTAEMSRRDLATKNAEIVIEIMKNTIDDNPKAWYFVITNPVDAMTTLANKIAGDREQVIGTGTNLETSRFRAVLSRELDVPVGLVEAYVGGEHGEAAVPLWSTVKIDGLPLVEYCSQTKKKLDNAKCENYVREVRREIIRMLGGTRYGSAGSFIEIIRGIILNTDRIVSYSRLKKFETTPEPVHVTVPARIARPLGPDLWGSLTDLERNAIKKSAGIIYKTYREACGA
jgi:malate dehydrogenase